MIKKEKLQVPDVPNISERKYIQNLNDAYSENAGKEINAIEPNDRYHRHLTRARTLFYESEEVKIASRKSTAPDSDEFDALKDSIHRHIGNELDDDYQDGFEKVNVPTPVASSYE